jgi:hypothetical protein
LSPDTTGSTGTAIAVYPREVSDTEIAVYPREVSDMGGRFTLKRPEEVAQHFEVVGQPSLLPR